MSRPPLSHVVVKYGRTTNRPPQGVEVHLFDQDAPDAPETDAFTPRESARLAAFFDAIPKLRLLPDETEAS